MPITFDENSDDWFRLYTHQVANIIGPQAEVMHAAVAISTIEIARDFEELPAGSLKVGLPEEFYWQNSVRPVPASLRPYNLAGEWDVEELPAGSLTTPFVPLPVVGVDVPDHATLAVNRLAQQFKDKPKIVALVRALCVPIQDIENALWQLKTQRGFNGIGIQLDLIGKIVGQPRNGLSDHDYLIYLRAKIAANNSIGTVENLLTVASLIVNDPTNQIQVTPYTVATLVVAIANQISPAVLTALNAFLHQAVAAGVRLMTVATVEPVANTFTFDGTVYQAFDNGYLAGGADK